MSAIINLGCSFCGGLRQNFRELRQCSNRLVEPLKENSQCAHGKRSALKTALKIGAIALTLLLMVGAVAGLTTAGFFAGAAIGGTLGIFGMPTSVALAIVGLKLGIVAAVGIGVLGINLIQKI